VAVQLLPVPVWRYACRTSTGTASAFGGSHRMGGRAFGNRICGCLVLPVLSFPFLFLAYAADDEMLVPWLAGGGILPARGQSQV